MNKEQQQPRWLINFPKIWSEDVLNIKTKSHKVWASQNKRFLIGSCESGHPPEPDRIKLKPEGITKEQLDILSILLKVWFMQNSKLPTPI